MSKYDLKERLLQFALSIINLTKKLEKNTANYVITSQIIRSATSIGANYEEADGARTKKEFIASVTIAKKEAKETKYWLNLVKLSNKGIPILGLDQCLQESDELIKILSKILINSFSS